MLQFRLVNQRFYGLEFVDCCNHEIIMNKFSNILNVNGMELIAGVLLLLYIQQTVDFDRHDVVSFDGAHSFIVSATDGSVSYQIETIICILLVFLLVGNCVFVIKLNNYTICILRCSCMVRTRGWEVKGN